VSVGRGAQGATKISKTQEKDFCYSNQINQFPTRSNQMTRTKKIERDDVQSELARSGVKRTLE